MRTEFNETVGYCDVADVGRYFRKSNFTDSAGLTSTDVNKMIMEASEDIDRRTGHAWRENRIIEETKNFSGVYRWWSGRPVNLAVRSIRTPLDSAQGDKLEVWKGDEYVDWVADTSKEEGRGGDYWIDGGRLYIYRRFFFSHGHPQFRLTYRYGEEQVSTQIRKACAKLVAADLIDSDQYSQLLPGTGDGVSPSEFSNSLREDAQEIIDDRSEVEYVEPF